ncbi:putative teichuronic acid biosynthesis glycosyltransferase TuaG [Methanobrevibacter cuticularis]|uniref:Putative teichuronic acid biosynthesis glycosyltransferase TuaG n=1 Tax=Methanobrevibacter cuticularis TaxID=47311 RepID=A0A166DW23_9EURY|nr:glycosyltransferase family 2 protein [Methanobrevibacter cuticularis]KZX16011.1 putative teichuronic acid biosynthesis glycosyltransferase TuaG [Methanobrevibacter cuticularis]
MSYIKINKFKVSVIIPTFNAEDYLLDTVNSVINQSLGFENIELVIVDDCSTDGTKDIIKMLLSKYENIISVFLKKNTGSPSIPRNVGINTSSSDYVMFLDNDDIYYPEICEKLYKEIKETNVDLVICRNKLLIDNEYQNNKSFFDNYDEVIMIKNIYEMPEMMSYSYTGSDICNKIFKKERLIKNNIFFPEEILYEDFVFNIKYFLSSQGIVFLNNYYGYEHKIRSDSISYTFKEKNLLKQLSGLKKVFHILKNKKEFDVFKYELLAGWTKLFLLTELNKKCNLYFLNEVKKMYKSYSLFLKLKSVNLLTNILVNLMIKLFSVNVKIAYYFKVIVFEIFIIKMFKKFK